MCTEALTQQLHVAVAAEFRPVARRALAKPLRALRRLDQRQRAQQQEGALQQLHGWQCFVWDPCRQCVVLGDPCRRQCVVWEGCVLAVPAYA